MRRIGDRMIEDAEKGGHGQRQELEDIRAFVAAHAEEFEMKRDAPMAVGIPIAEAIGMETGRERRLRDYVEAVRRAGEMFPRRGQAKAGKKRSVRVATYEEQIRNADAMFEVSV